MKNKHMAKMGRHSGALQVLARLHRISNLIERRPLTATDIAGREEVSTRTVYRCIDFLRDVTGWDIVPDRNTGYRIIKKGQPLLTHEK